ncbi:adhesion G-protein coupled receptor V1-like [Stegodyphus dumicola]|uniref:adhesion G-protein coupled receptor V1-like n=1 Tax=Stegodyphus dumicola TaxID=202533 RepID=UPI0015AF45C6|nr:adhesion G-protein coupled receptor V1-like [Stegodyphus dumicola]
MGKSSIAVPESVGEVRLPVIRKGGSDGKLTVQYTTVDGSASARTDYLPASGLLVFQDGEILKTITLVIVNDNILEPNESFQVKLRNSMNAIGVTDPRLLGSATSTLIEIVDDDFKAGFIEIGKTRITVPESTGQVTLPVVRRGGSDGKLTVEYTTVDGSASAQTDYLPASGLLIFQDGEILKTVTVIIVNDNILEPNESFQVKLRNSKNAVGVTDPSLLGPAVSSVIEIVDDDFKAGCIEMGKPSVTVPESTGQIILPVVRRGGSDGKLTVEYTTVDGTARVHTDYLPASGLLVFQDGEILRTITVIIVNDNILEPNESFHVKLSNTMNAVGVTDPGLLGSAVSTLIEIVDDDFKAGYIEMGKPSITVPESTGQIILPVVRRGGSNGKLTVEYTTVDGSASAQTDYVPSSGVLVFQDGEILKTITVVIVNDKILEPNESFQVKLKNSKNAAGITDPALLGPAASILIEIVDDDSNPAPLLERNVEFSFRSTNIRVRENAGVVRFHIKRTGDSSVPVSIFLITRDGTAKGGEDYRRTRGTISFASDDIELTLQINLIDDDKPELDETFQILLSKPSTGAIIPGRDILTITIEDDDNQGNTKQTENTSVQSVHKNIQPPISESYFIASVMSQGNSQASAQISSSQHILSKPALLEGTSQSNSQLDKISQSSVLTSSSSHLFFPKLNVAGGAISQVSNSGDYSQTSLQLSSSQLPKLPQSEGIISQTGSQSITSSQIQSQQSSTHSLTSKPKEGTSHLSSQAQSGSQVVNIAQTSSQMISSQQSSSSSQMSSSSQSSSSLQMSSSSHHLQGTISQASSASGDYSKLSLQQSSAHFLSQPPSSEVVPQSGSHLLLNSNECATGLIYKECTPSCPKTCQNMNIEQSPCAAKGCIRGCHCPEGYVKEHASSNNCILPQQCKN